MGSGVWMRLLSRDMLLCTYSKCFVQCSPKQRPAAQRKFPIGNDRSITLGRACFPRHLPYRDVLMPVFIEASSWWWHVGSVGSRPLGNQAFGLSLSTLMLFSLLCAVFIGVLYQIGLSAQ